MYNTPCKAGVARYDPHTGQCKSTGDCYNELVVAKFCTGAGVK